MRIPIALKAAAVALALAATPALAQERVAIGTGGTGGLFYVIGAGMADIFNKHMDNTTARAEVTGASVENIRRVAADQMTFGFSSSSTLYEAKNGMGPFDGDAQPVAAMAYLYPAVLQIATVADTGITSLEDLAGKKVNLGPPGSNAAVLAQRLLEAYGVFDAGNAQFLSYTEGTNALMNGTVDATVVLAGAPTAALIDLDAQRDMVLLPLDETEGLRPFRKIPLLSALRDPGRHLSGPEGRRDGDQRSGHDLHQRRRRRGADQHDHQDHLRAPGRTRRGPPAGEGHRARHGDQDADRPASGRQGLLRYGKVGRTIRDRMSSIIDRIRLDRAADRSEGEAAIVSLLFAVLAVAVTALVIYGAYFGLITALILRSLFYSLVSAGGLLLVGLNARADWTRILCYALVPVALVPGFHLWQSYIDIIMRGAMATPPDLWIFVGVMAVLLVLVRMALGWALVVLVGAALAYAWFGYLIPGQYGHGGYDLRRLASTLMLSTEGIYGLPMGVAVEYIFLFALLGTLLMKIGTGEVFVDIARGLTGPHAGRAGPLGGAVERAARHDQRQRGGQRRDDGHLHHPFDEACRLFADARRRHRGGRLVRRTDPSAGHGRGRLPDGGNHRRSLFARSRSPRWCPGSSMSLP